MSQHLTGETMARYRQKSLAPQELLAADDHLAECAACRESLLGAAALQDAFTALRTDLLTSSADIPEHLSYDTLVAYVEATGYGVANGMDAIDREIVESHLELCSSCASEVRELRAFQTLVTGTPEEYYTPRSRWEQWVLAWQSPRRLAPLVLGLASGAALLATVFVLHPWQNPQQTPGDVAANPAPPPAPSSRMPIAAREETAAPSQDVAQTSPPTPPALPESDAAPARQDRTTISASAAPPKQTIPPQTAQNPSSASGANRLPGTPAPTLPQPSEASAHVASKNIAPRNPVGDAAHSGASLPDTVEPGDAKAWVERGNTRLLNGRYEQAAADFTRAAELDPTSSAAWEGLSWSQFLAGKWDDALTSNAKALELNKESVALHFRRGLIYAARGDTENAQSEYNRALPGAAPTQKRAALKEAQDARRLHPDSTALPKVIEWLQAAP